MTSLPAPSIYASLSAWFNPWHAAPTAERLRAAQLEGARQELLTYAAQREYYAAMESMLISRIARLNGRGAP